MQDQEPPPEAERQEPVEDDWYNYNPSAWFGVVGYDGVVKTGVDDESVMLFRKSRRSRRRIRNHRLRQSARSRMRGFLSVPPGRGSIFRWMRRFRPMMRTARLQ